MALTLKFKKTATPGGNSPKASNLTLKKKTVATGSKLSIAHPKSAIQKADEAEYPLSYKGERLGQFSKEVILKKLQDGEIDLEAMLKIDNVWKPLSDSGWDFSEEALPVDEQPVDTGNDAASESASLLSFDDNTEQNFDQPVTCPHCWHKFDLSQINYIAQHLELIGDSVLGAEAQQRFLPTAFNAQGYAIDAKGMVCQDMACPNCHQKIPEAVIDLPCCTFSIAGAPASGKSYYLTAMTWQMRSILASNFDYTMADTDATFNSVLNSYESILFLNRKEDEYVALPKTELQGNDFSHQIMLKGMSVDLPLPFIFTLTPSPSNTHFSNPRDGMENVILYDNAGEHFEPGRDQITNMATRHLIQSDGIMFLYDPIKDSRMVVHCNSSDPQVAQINRGANQLVLLNEMIARIKKYKGLKSQDKYNKPLVIIIPKYDAWRDIFPVNLEETPFTLYDEKDMIYNLDVGTVTNVSYIMRNRLLEISPELVATCESFFSTVYFIPVSALGRMPEYDKEKDMIAIKPQHLHPIWAEVPMLLQLWLAGKLPGSMAQYPDATPVESFKFAGNSIIFMLPGTTIRETLPITYSGHTLYNMKLNQFIKLPPAPQEAVVTPQTTSKAADAAEDDFWKA